MFFIFVCSIILAIVALVVAIITLMETNDLQLPAIGVMACLLFGLVASTVNEGMDDIALYKAQANQYQQRAENYYQESLKSDIKVITIQRSLEETEARLESTVARLKASKMQLAKSQDALTEAEGKLQAIQKVIEAKKGAEK